MYKNWGLGWTFFCTRDEPWRANVDCWLGKCFLSCLWAQRDCNLLDCACLCEHSELSSEPTRLHPARCTAHSLTRARDSQKKEAWSGYQFSYHTNGNKLCFLAPNKSVSTRQTGSIFLRTSCVSASRAVPSDDCGDGRCCGARTGCAWKRSGSLGWRLCTELDLASS